MTSDLKCLRCHYAWKRRTWNRLPRQCPNCHRNDWNKPEVGPVGRPPLKVKEKVMPVNAKAAQNEPMESVRSETHPDNCECGLCPPDHRNVLIGPIGSIGPQFKHKAYGVTSKNMVPHVLTEDELNSPPQAKGEVEAIVRKIYDDVVASLVRGPNTSTDEQKQTKYALHLSESASDTPTDDLLNHLLEQIERDGVE